MYKICGVLILFFWFSKVFCQEPIEVTDQTIKLGAMADEEIYFGFAEGDKLIFDFEELKGKELKEVEIIEMPGSSRFMDYKTKRIKEKTIDIKKTGIYKFRFSNSALTGRICKFKIQRIPLNETTKKFDTEVYWRTIRDTSYYMDSERYLISKDTAIHNITDQIAKVHSVGNLNGSTATFNFQLPSNTVSWSYYIGVDQKGQEVFEQATRQLSKTAGPILYRMPGYGPLAALALGGVSYLTALQTGEDVDFYIVDGDNVNLFTAGLAFKYWKKGKVINDFSKMTYPLNGVLHFCLSNDNAITPVSVTVKVTAITVKENWGLRDVRKYRVNSHEEAYLKN